MSGGNELRDPIWKCYSTCLPPLCILVNTAAYTEVLTCEGKKWRKVGGTAQKRGKRDEEQQDRGRQEGVLGSLVTERENRLFAIHIEVHC